MRDSIQIAPNVPLYLALANPAAAYDFESELGRYQTTDGRTLELPYRAVCVLNMLEAKPGEEIQVTKIWTGKPGELPQWSICLSTRSEQARAASESTQGLTDQLEASLVASGARRTIVAPVKPDTTSAGRYPVFPLAASPVTTPRKEAPSGPIPANVATREILQFIELDPNTKNWSDQAKQDLASTVYISACKSKWIGLWERAK